MATHIMAEDVIVNISIDDTDATVSVTNVFDATKFEPKLNYVSENSEGVRISSNVYIVGYSSAAEYYGCGQYLTGLTAENANTLDFHDSTYFAVKADVAGSTAALKGLIDTNTAGVANLETSTAALALRAYNLEQATQTLKTDINSNDTELEALRVSTGALLAIQNTIRVDTGTLRIDVDGKESELAFISEDADGVQISSSVYSTGISSFTAYYGDGSNLTGIDVGFVSTADADLDMADNHIVNISSFTPSSSGLLSLFMDMAVDHYVIHQSSNIGIASQPLIFYNDDRIGTTANSKEEATIVGNAEGSYFLYVMDGQLYFGTKVQFYGTLNEFAGTAYFKNNIGLFFGNGLEGQIRYGTGGRDSLRFASPDHIDFISKGDEGFVSPLSAVRDLHVNIWNDAADKYLTFYSSTTYAHIDASHPAGISIDTHTVVNGGLYPQSDSSLPTAGYDEGSLFYNTDDNTLYISTETVTSAESWKSVW